MSPEQASAATAKVGHALSRCSASERAVFLCEMLGRLIAAQPADRHAVVRALFIEIVDRAAANAMIGEPVGSA